MKKESKSKQTNKIERVIGAIMVALVAVLICLSPIGALDSTITDRLFRKLTGPDPKIVIISVDEETLETYGSFTKWSREKSADLLQLFNQNPENKPELVALDIMFQDDEDEAVDKRLADEVAEHGNVVCASHLVFKGKTEISESGKVIFDSENIESNEEPYELLRKVTVNGFANVFIANDGRVRFAQNTFNGNGTLYKSFAYTIYEKHCERTGSECIPPKTDANGRYMFFYSGEVGEYQHVSLKRVLNQEIPISLFKDAIVLVGGYAPGLQDSYHTAVSYDEVMYGVEIQANILQSLMSQRTAIPLNRYLHAVIALIVLGVYYSLIRRQRLSVVLISSVVLLGGYLCLASALAHFGYTMSVIYEILFFVITDVYFIINKYVIERIHRIRYQEELQEQMWSFTEAMAEAIDARTPYNATHTKHVAEYAGLIVNKINEQYRIGKEDEEFDQRRKDQVMMAALLHDVGKVVTPLEIMNKATRLGDKEKEVLDRMKIFALMNELKFCKGIIGQKEFEETADKLEKAVAIVKDINAAGFVNDEKQAVLEDIIASEFTTIDGETVSFFNEDEKTSLRVVKGTLTVEERKIMENHVVMTERILSKVHFNKYFEDAPKWAVMHHECINGKGYPYNISEDELPIEARIIAVADICDALLATDRPYKKPLPKEKAYAIMKDMADSGNIEMRYVDYLFEKI